MSHIRRKHLGSSVACKFCDQRWWTTAPFTKHMEKKHLEVESPPARWTPLQPAERKKQEEEEAAATEKPTSPTPLM